MADVKRACCFLCEKQSIREQKHPQLHSTISFRIRLNAHENDQTRAQLSSILGMAMSTDSLTSEIAQLEPRSLNPIIRMILGNQGATALGSPSAQPLDVISYGLGTIALIMVQGDAQTAGRTQKWSVVLKAMELEEDDEWRGDPRVEIRAYNSPYLEPLRQGMRAAKCYSIDRRAQNQVWLWLEDLSGWIAPPWSIHDYLRACEDVGHFTGYWSKQELPDAEFFSHDRIFTRFDPLPLIDASHGWSGPTHVARNDVDDYADLQRRLQSSLSDNSYSATSILGRSLALARPKVIESPRVFVHGDCHPRNLFLSQPGSKPLETAAIDWSSVGTGPIGTDMGTLIGSGMSWGTNEFETILKNERKLFEACLSGLRKGGWSGANDEARFQYLFVVCGYAMLMTCIAISVARSGPQAGFFVKRTGEKNEKDAARAYADRSEKLVPLAEELISLCESRNPS